MENPSDVKRDKRFRWVGRVSEEELLGLPAAGLHRRDGHAPARLAPMPTRSEDTQLGPRLRWGSRDVAVVVAVGGAVWLALNVAQSRLPHYEGVDVVPTLSGADTGAFVVPPDRSELASLPRESPTSPKPHSTAGAASNGGHAGGSRSDDGDSGGSGGPKDEDPTPPPPTDTSKPPLVEANLPVVGNVKVEEPEVPDVEDVLPETPTLPLP